MIVWFFDRDGGIVEGKKLFYFFIERGSYNFGWMEFSLKELICKFMIR